MDILEKIKFTIENSPFYKEHITSSVTNIEDIKPTTKKDLSENASSFLCVSESKVSETVSTSGTTGAPLYIKLTYEDILRLKEIEKKNFIDAGFDENDNVQIMTTSDKLFIAGQAYYSGLQELGANIIRTGSGNSLFQIKTATDLKTNSVVSVPSYLLKLAAIDRGWAKKITKAVLVGEPIISNNLTLNSVGQKIKDLYPECKLYSSYGNTEIQGSFCGTEAGVKADKDFFYVEILDSNDTPIEDNRPGEITITTIGITGMPLIRYKTGDISFWVNREEQILGPVIGRKNELLKTKGTSIFPSAIINTLTEIKEVFDFVIKATKTPDGDDNIIIYADIDHPRFIRAIQEKIRTDTKVTPSIHKVALKDLERIREPYKTRKKTFFIDNR